MAVSAVAIASSAAASVAFEYATMAVVGSAFAVEVAAVAIGAVAAIGTVYAINSIATATGIIPKAPDASAGQTGAEAARGILLNTQSSVAPIPVVYGSRRVGGNMVYIGATGSGNEYLHLVLTLAEGEIDSVEKIYFNDEEAINLTGVADATQTSASTGKWSGLLDATWHSGTAAQNADTNMTAQIAAWTSTHKLSGVAYLYLRLKYDQTAYATGLPQITVDVNGRKTYDPRSSTTTFNHNPALALRDYLTNSIYGRGIPSANIDDVSFIAAANYCDQTVTLGGSTVARYTCDGVVETTRSSLDIARDLLTACRGLMVFTGGKYKIVLDKPESPVSAFTEDNIVGQWTISMGDKTNTFNRLRAGFFNPANDWQSDIVVAESTALRTQDNGLLLERQIDLPFTAHAERALMIATMNLNQSRQQVSCEFTATLAGLKCEVGDVVYIKHRTPGWSDLNGGLGKAFRVLKIALQNNDEVRVVVVEYDATVYDFGTIATIDATPNTTLPSPLVVATPGVPSITEAIYETKGGAGVKAKAIITTANGDAFVTEYQYEAKLTTASTWTIYGRSSGTTFEILDIAPGRYDFRVKAINTLGASSAYAERLNAEVVGLSAAPAAITGLSVQAAGGLAILNWSLPSDLDVRIGGKVRVRHSASLSGATWETSVSIGEAAAGNATVAVLPLKAGTYLLKAEDSSGIQSVTATGASTKHATALTFSPLTTVQEDDDWLGIHTDTVAEVVDAVTYLQLESIGTLDAQANFDAIDNLAALGGIQSSGTYDFAAGMDLGTVKRVRLTTSIVAQIINALDQFDNRAANIDTWANFDGNAGAAADAWVEVRETDDNPAGSPTWSAWKRLDASEFDARGFDFRARLTTTDPAYNIQISQLRVAAAEI